MDVEVVAVTVDGRPKTVAFTFHPSADDERFRWVLDQAEHFVAFTPPRVGESTELPALPFDPLSP